MNSSSNKKEPFLVFEFSKCSSDEKSSLLCPTQLRWTCWRNNIYRRIYLLNYSAIRFSYKITKRISEGNGKNEPLNMACLFIEDYWSAGETNLKYSIGKYYTAIWKTSLIFIISPICFRLNCVKNGNKNSWTETHVKVKNKQKLDRKVSNFVKIF